MQTVFDRHVDRRLIDRSLSDSAFGSMWLAELGAARPQYPALAGPLRCDLLVVGGGYTGLWTALHAAQQDPSASIVLIEADRIGWAASGRNGGFVDASLTHGTENGRSRWPDELAELEALGLENLDGMQDEIARLGLDTEWERTGMLSVAVEPHQVEWLRAAADAGEGQFLTRDQVRAQLDSPTYLAGLFNPQTCALVNPAKLAVELARACTEAGVSIYERCPATAVRPVGAEIQVSAGHDIIAARVVLATNVFASLLRRNRFHTVPVYDYVLGTEPLSGAQLDRIGWQARQGVGDSGNQFHYYRLSADNRILWGGYDAVYHFGRRVDPSYEHRPRTYRRLAAHFFLTFPQLADVRFDYHWAGAIDTNTRFCAHWGQAHRGRVAYVNGFTGLGVGAARFAADVCLDLVYGRQTARTRLEMVRSKPLPFPPEPLASVGIQATRWSLDRADHRSGRRNAILKTLDRVGLGFDS